MSCLKSGSAPVQDHLAHAKTEPEQSSSLPATRSVNLPTTSDALSASPGPVGEIAERKRLEQELHRLSQGILRARDEERRSLARELHQSAGQTLAALTMSLGNLRDVLHPRNTRAHSLLEDCAQLADEAVREVRTISYLMHPPLLDEAGLASAVPWYTRGFTRRSRIDVVVDVPEDFGRLPYEVELAIFRLIQEALTNVHRYSGSHTARILLARGKGHVRVEVADQGCGLAHSIREGSGEGTGVGIASMRERIHELNGLFEIESTPGQGTTVRALLPDSVPRSHQFPDATDGISSTALVPSSAAGRF